MHTMSCIICFSSISTNTHFVICVMRCLSTFFLFQIFAHSNKKSLGNFMHIVFKMHLRLIDYRLIVLTYGSQSYHINLALTVIDKWGFWVYHSYYDKGYPTRWPCTWFMFVATGNWTSISQTQDKHHATWPSGFYLIVKIDVLGKSTYHLVSICSTFWFLCVCFFFISNKSLFTEYELPAYFVKFDVTYNLNTLASNCVQNFNALLKDTNATIGSNIDSFCRLLDPGKFIIDSISSSASTFKVSICLSLVGNLFKNMISFFLKMKPVYPEWKT